MYRFWYCIDKVTVVCILWVSPLLCVTLEATLLCTYNLVNDIDTKFLTVHNLMQVIVMEKLYYILLYK